MGTIYLGEYRCGVTESVKKWEGTPSPRFSRSQRREKRGEGVREGLLRGQGRQAGEGRAL